MSQPCNFCNGAKDGCAACGHTGVQPNTPTQPATITKPLVNAYVREDGTVCPFCGHTDLEGESVSVDGGMASQPITCTGCKATWTDIYRLAGMSQGELDLFAGIGSEAAAIAELKRVRAWMEDCLFDRQEPGVPSRERYNAVCAALATRA